MFCQILYTKELHCRVNFLLHFGLPSNFILIGEGLKKFDTCIVMPANPLVLTIIQGSRVTVVMVYGRGGHECVL